MYYWYGRHECLTVLLVNKKIALTLLQLRVPGTWYAFPDSMNLKSTIHFQINAFRHSKESLHPSYSTFF